MLSMRERRLVVDASMEGAALADWILPASMSLSRATSGMMHPIFFDQDSLLARQRKLVAACDGLDDNVLVLDALLPELCECAVEECVDDPVVPPRMHDGDPEARAVVCLGRRGKTLDGGVEHCGVVIQGKWNMGNER